MAQTMNANIFERKSEANYQGYIDEHSSSCADTWKE